MKKPILHRAAERGQAIVLVDALMVVLIASVGLAIDGGGLILLYRDVQNATDSAALRSAFALCTGQNVATQGQESADLNGFVDGINNATVTVVNPIPDTVDVPSQYHDNNRYLYVEIQAEKPSYFIQVVYPGPLVVRSSTIAQCVSGSNGGLPPTTAIASLKDTCSNAQDNGVRGRGNNTTTVEGDIYSRMPAGCEGFDTGGNSDWSVDGKICTDGTVDKNDNDGTPNVQDAGGGDVEIETPCTEDDDITDDPFGMVGNEPTCDMTVDHGSLASYAGGTAPAGYYSGSWTTVSSTGDITLASGTYCISDGVDIKSTIDTAPGGITIFHDCTGVTPASSCTFEIGAQGDVELIGRESGQWEGLLLYSNSTDISQNGGHAFGGGGTFVSIGTVYAPFSNCTLTGGSDTTVIGQYICWEVSTAGNTPVVIRYEPSAVYSFPPNFGLVE